MTQPGVSPTENSPAEGVRRRRVLVKRKKRSRRVRNPYLLSLALALCSVAFLAGYSWQASRQQAEEGVEVVATVARVSAADAIDEAVRARYEKRPEAAQAALDRARQTDPTVPGIDVLRAEVALEQKNLVELRRSAATARSKDDHAASASVLLGVDKWISRGVGDRNVSTDAEFAGGYFDEATQIDFFAAPAWFFWGDFLRYAGSEQDGGSRIISALHRFGPWNSSDLIVAKALAAAAQTGAPGRPDLAFLPDSPWRFAVARAAEAGEPLGAAFAAQTTMRQAASDPFLRQKAFPAGAPPGRPVLPLRD